MKFGPCVNVNSRSLSESELNRSEGLFRIRGISVVLFWGVSTTLLLVLEQEDMDWQIWEVLLVAETPDNEGWVPVRAEPLFFGEIWKLWFYVVAYMECPYHSYIETSINSLIFGMKNFKECSVATSIRLSNKAGWVGLVPRMIKHTAITWPLCLWRSLWLLIPLQQSTAFSLSTTTTSKCYAT